MKAEHFTGNHRWNLCREKHGKELVTINFFLFYWLGSWLYCIGFSNNFLFYYKLENMNRNMMKIFTISILTILFSCNQPVKQASPKIARYGMITGIIPGKLEYYKQLHAKPWPQVIAKNKRVQYSELFYLPAKNG